MRYGRACLACPTATLRSSILDAAGTSESVGAVPSATFLTLSLMVPPMWRIRFALSPTAVGTRLYHFRELATKYSAAVCLSSELLFQSGTINTDCIRNSRNWNSVLFRLDPSKPRATFGRDPGEPVCPNVPSAFPDKESWGRGADSIQLDCLSPPRRGSRPRFGAEPQKLAPGEEEGPCHRSRCGFLSSVISFRRRAISCAGFPSAAGDRNLSED